MISAVADSCNVRLDKVNGKVYRFHALVFNPGKNLFSLLSLRNTFFPCKKLNRARSLTARGDLFF